MASTTKIQLGHNLVLGRNTTKQCDPLVPIISSSESKLLQQKGIRTLKQPYSDPASTSKKPILPFHRRLETFSTLMPSNGSTISAIRSTVTPNQSSSMSRGRGAVTLQNTAIIKNAADNFLALHKTKLAMCKVQNRSTHSYVPSSSDQMMKLNGTVELRNDEITPTSTQSRNAVPSSRQSVADGHNNFSPTRNRSFENQMTKGIRLEDTLVAISETAVDSPRMRADESKMAAYLVCLTSGGGVPLFTRKTADFKSLPFPLVGSLNGVHMFAKSHDATLLTTSSEDTDVAWREFNESITLIVVLKDGERRRTERSDGHLYDFLETVFDAMVLLIGLDNIVNTNNVERLKRDLKCCFCLVDALLSQLTQPSESLSFVGDVSRSADCIVCPESTSLQSYLDSFVESAYCNYGCVLVRGKVVVATKEWWTLDGRESSLLLFFLASTSKATCKDVPVFLPVENPTVAHRLLVFQLVQGVEVCVLCGPTPSLMQLQKEVGRTWKNAYEHLKASLHCHPRNFPENVLLDKHILGFILINIKDRKSLCSVHPHRNESEGVPNSDSSKITSEHRLQILRSYYKLTVSTVFREASEEGSEATNVKPLSKDRFFGHCCQETYLIAKTHKLYALRTDQYKIFVLYSLTMPSFALRGITNTTLQLLTSGKHLRV